MPCAICDMTNDCPNICNACKKDPANKGWNGKAWRTPYGEPTAALTADRKPRDVTPLQAQILDLATLGKKIPYAYVDKKGRRRGWRFRLEQFSARQLASAVGCDHRYVLRVLALKKI